MDRRKKQQEFAEGTDRVERVDNPLGIQVGPLLPIPDEKDPKKMRMVCDVTYPDGTVHEVTSFMP